MQPQTYKKVLCDKHIEKTKTRCLPLSLDKNQIKTNERYSVNLKQQNYWRKRREVLQGIGIGQDFLNTDSNSSDITASASKWDCIQWKFLYIKGSNFNRVKRQAIESGKKLCPLTWQINIKITWRIKKISTKNIIN